MKLLASALIAAAGALALPAFAQDNDSKITLRVEAGSVMASTGGQYQSANTGKPLVTGEKIMVNAGSAAAAVFENGCTVEFRRPGIYEVPGDCRKVAWINHGNAGMNAAVIVGAGLIGAVLINPAGDTPVGPLSTGIRHF